eukprot:4904136-Ditylum_brightwellii.AAC.1
MPLMICLIAHFSDVYKKLYINRGSCPGIHAESTATKGLAQQPKPQRRPYQRGSLEKKQCGTEGSKAGSPPPVFGGEGHQPILHINKENATCNLKKNSNLSTIQPAYAKR